MHNRERDPFKDFEFPEINPIKKRGFKRFKKILGKTNAAVKFIAPYAALSALTLAIIGISFGFSTYKSFSENAPANNGYVAPRDPGQIVDIGERSTVEVICSISEDDITSGSGWAIDLKTLPGFKSSVVTNYHVIKDCLKGKGLISVVDYDGSEYKALAHKLDKKNDLALISTEFKLEPFKLSPNFPYPGYWVMTIGTSVGYQGSISFGAVKNVDGNEIFITANISHGNSGGPLLDNEGYVIGTNTWIGTEEQINGAMSLDAMCAKILKCKFNKGKEFWDYS